MLLKKIKIIQSEGGAGGYILFFIYPRKFWTKQGFLPGNCVIVLHPLEIPRPNIKIIENSISFFIDHHAILFLANLWKFINSLAAKYCHTWCWSVVGKSRESYNILV